MALRLRIRFVLAAMIVFFSPGPVFAHLVNTDVGGFYGGMVHPLTSVEHLLPILALGLLAGQCGRRAARWTLLLFPLVLMAGIWIGSRYPGAAFAQVVNLTLLAVLGGLLAFAQRVPDGVVAGAAVATGMVLGYRSGVDMAAAGVGFPFIPGVALTGLIIIALLAAWVPEADGRFSRTLRVGLGAGLSLAGGVMALAVFTGLGWNAIRGVGFPSGADLLSMVRGGEISVSMVAASLAGSAFWGAGHALTPGHGKAIVAAYLVGARSTPWHAVYLGLTVTATHTLTIFALGLVTLFGSRYVMTEQLYPWLSLVSGLVIVWLGVVMAVSRIRGLAGGSVHHNDHSHLGHSHHDHPHSAQRHGDGEDHHHHDHSPDHDDGHHHPHGFGAHDHDHSRHDHSHMPPGADGSPVTWRSLLALGVSGGILPCPSALVLLLAAVSLGRVGFGMVLVAAFSAGLAGVLIAVGLLFVKGGRLIGQAPRLQGAVRWMPAASAVAILVIGVMISLGAVNRIMM